MNKEDTIAAIKVMQASLDGSEIEWRGKNEKVDWRKTYSSGPSWDWCGVEYRIKPEPREWLLAKDGVKYSVTEGGRVPGSVVKVPGKPFDAEIIHVREVL